MEIILTSVEIILTSVEIILPNVEISLTSVEIVLPNAGFPVCFSHKISGFVQVQKVIPQVILWTILTPKGSL